MKRPVLIIAAISVLLTAALWLHEYLYDKPSVPYTTSQYIIETLTIGPFFCVIIFALLYLPYAIFKSLVRKIRRSGR